MPPKDDKKKKDAGKSAKKDKDPVNKSGGKAKKRLIKLVSKHRAQVIYTRNTKGGDAPAASEDA
uniref:Uncharacterized protein n=1 Tax=Colobus angolensis palliatus TaxID=336983 RepID=A0A2K5KG98_COLAP